MQQGSHRRVTGRGERGSREGGRVQSLGTRVAEEKEKEREKTETEKKGRWTRLVEERERKTGVGKAPR